MDGRVGAIVTALDAAGCAETAIALRRASTPRPSTGRPARPPARPRRSAIGVASIRSIPPNVREAIREALADVERGRRHGDGQAGATLPRRDSAPSASRVDVPIVAYQVSMSSPMLLRRRRARLDSSPGVATETVVALRCAADILITYFARELAETLGGKVAGHRRTRTPMTPTPTASAATRAPSGPQITPGGGPFAGCAPSRRCAVIQSPSSLGRGAHVHDATGRDFSTHARRLGTGATRSRPSRGRAGGGGGRQPRPRSLAWHRGPNWTWPSALPRGCRGASGPLRVERHRSDDERAAARARLHRARRDRQVRRLLPRSLRRAAGESGQRRWPPSATPDSAGVPAAVVANTASLPFNDPGALERAVSSATVSASPP